MPAKQSATKQATAKKATGSKAPAKRAPAKKAPVKKTAVKKAPVKKAEAKKAPAKAKTTKRAPAKQAPATKASAKAATKTATKAKPATKSTAKITKGPATKSASKPAKAKPAKANRLSLFLPPRTKEERASLSRTYEQIGAELDKGELGSKGPLEELSEFSIIGHDGKEIRMPIEVVQVLKKICELMRGNDAITTSQEPLEISKDHATHLLEVEDSELAELTESGEIPNVGSADDPRFKLADVLAVRKQFDDEWRRNWELSNQLEYEMGMHEKTATPMPARR